MYVFSVAVVIKKGNKILGVSRKDDHNDFAIVGGKVDPGETMEEAIRRETMEETGLDLINLKFQFIRDCIHIDKSSNTTSLKPCAVFTADYKGEINHNEPHVVEWCSVSKILEGSFGEFNGYVFDYLGIK